MSVDVDGELRAALGELKVHRNAPLAPLTTFRVGGHADWLVDVHGAAEVQQVLLIARAAGVEATILGGGSNVLVADDGLRGVVLRIRGGDVWQVDATRIRADAGVTINGLVRWTINRGLAGLEAWAGTPGTVGGAIHGNAHFKGRLIGELVDRVALTTRDGTTIEVAASEMEFGYDFSRLHRTQEVVITAHFHVKSGDPASLRAVARDSLTFRKGTQPLESASAGCIFQNPNPATEPVPVGIPASAGALVDKAGLKGAREGHAYVSPTHANFIVNEGGARAADVKALMDLAQRVVWERDGVWLEPEVQLVGSW
jgi:UDP-N-acetylmuramate dehydrogenase